MRATPEPVCKATVHAARFGPNINATVTSGFGQEQPVEQAHEYSQLIRVTQAPACHVPLLSGPVLFGNLVNAVNIPSPRHSRSAEPLHLRDQLTALFDRADA
jgi:hypothetical protein